MNLWPSVPKTNVLPDCITTWFMFPNKFTILIALSVCPSVCRGPDFGFQDLDGQDLFFFFFPPFSGGLRKVILGFFFRPFSAGCPELIPRFFFSPFSGGLPRVNTRGFFFFFPKLIVLKFSNQQVCNPPPWPPPPFSSHWLIPGFFFPGLFRWAAQGNTRLFFPPFSGGLPRVNTKVFFPALFQRVAKR